MSLPFSRSTEKNVTLLTFLLYHSNNRPCFSEVQDMCCHCFMCIRNHSVLILRIKYRPLMPRWWTKRPDVPHWNGLTNTVVDMDFCVLMKSGWVTSWSQRGDVWLHNWFILPAPKLFTTFYNLVVDTSLMEPDILRDPLPSSICLGSPHSWSRRPPAEHSTSSNLTSSSNQACMLSNGSYWRLQYNCYLSKEKRSHRFLQEPGLNNKNCVDYKNSSQELQLDLSIKQGPLHQEDVFPLLRSFKLTQAHQRSAANHVMNGSICVLLLWL